MAEPYIVALVLDPDFGERLMVLTERVHTWAIESPANSAVAKRIWDALPNRPEYSIESGITIFNADSQNDRDLWFEALLADLDLHHGQYSHDPAVSVLEVYGIALTEKLRPVFAEVGFDTFEETAYGFRALTAQV